MVEFMFPKQWLGVYFSSETNNCIVALCSSDDMDT